MHRSFFSTLLLFAAACLLMTNFASAYSSDTNVMVPPKYYGFTPPAAGGSYVDPAFGTTITRIGNSQALGVQNDESEYSTVTPFNSDNSKILLIEFSQFALYDGNTMARIQALPGVSSSSEPRWSRTDPNTFYYHVYGANQLLKYNIATGTTSVVHTFGEYHSITVGNGEGDISFDGDHFAFVGDNRYVFVYTISSDTKGPAFDTSGGSMDAVYISPNNNVLIAWGQRGTGRFQGEELFDSNMSFLRQVADNDEHKHMTRDVDGSEVLIQSDGSPTPMPGCPGGIVKINLANAAKTCIFNLTANDNWSDAVHISAPDSGGWAFIETYNSSASQSPWYPYTNEILQIKLDGSEVRRLAHHRSNTSAYDGQPRVSVSRDGSRLLFNSNMMNPAGSNVDAYLMMIPGAVPAATQSSAPSQNQPVSSNPTSAPAPAPASTTPVRIQENNSAITYSGSWYTANRSFFNGGAAAAAMSAGDSATVTFTGTGITWLGYRDEWSGMAQVYIDGSPVSTVDTYVTPGGQGTPYSVSNLARGTHTLKIVALGSANGSSSGSWIWIDAFDVLP